MTELMKMTNVHPLTGEEPVAVKCNYCLDWSRYELEYNNRLPKGWRETNKGYQCNSCRKGK